MPKDEKRLKSPQVKSSPLAPHCSSIKKDPSFVWNGGIGWEKTKKKRRNSIPGERSPAITSKCRLSEIREMTVLSKKEI